MFSSIKRAVVSDSSDKDESVFRIKQMSYFGKTTTVELLSPYGFDYNPPLDSMALAFAINNDEGNLIAMAYKPDERFRGLKEGEVAVGNPVTGSVVKFLKSGDIEITGKKDINVSVAGNITINVAGEATIKAEKVTVDAPLTSLKGALEVEGSITATQDVTALTDTVPITFSGIIGKYNSHGHEENGQGNITDPPDNQLP